MDMSVFTLRDLLVASSITDHVFLHWNTSLASMALHVPEFLLPFWPFLFAGNSSEHSQNVEGFSRLSWGLISFHTLSLSNCMQPIDFKEHLKTTPKFLPLAQSSIMDSRQVYQTAYFIPLVCLRDLNLMCPNESPNLPPQILFLQSFHFSKKHHRPPGC